MPGLAGVHVGDERAHHHTSHYDSAQFLNLYEGHLVGQRDREGCPQGLEGSPPSARLIWPPVPDLSQLPLVTVCPPADTHQTWAGEREREGESFTLLSQHWLVRPCLVKSHEPDCEWLLGNGRRLLDPWPEISSCLDSSAGTSPNTWATGLSRIICNLATGRLAIRYAYIS